MQFRLRYSLLGTAIVAGALFVFGWLVYHLVANTQALDQDRALRARALEAAAGLSGGPPPAGSGIAAGAEDLRRHTDIFIEVLDETGSVISSTGQIDGVAPGVPANSLRAAAQSGEMPATIDPGGGPQLRVAIAPLHGAGQPTVAGFVVAGQPTSIQAQNLNGIKGFLFVSAVPTLLAAFVAIWLVTGRLSRSYDALIRRRDESSRQLEAALQAQRRFVADASHELRTPLTTIRGNAGLLAFGPGVSDEVRAAAARDIASESERMNRLVEQLLTLARADAGQGLELAPLTLRPLVEAVVRQAQAVHPDRRVREETTRDVAVQGDQDALVQLLWILVDNAVKFTRANGCIAISLGQDERRAVLSVADDGTGIPPAELDRVFDRFCQADASRSSKGAGLGLAIARWIVEQHGGTIGVRNNDGPGCTVTALFPSPLGD